MTVLITSGGKTVAYETDDTWPAETKRFNMSAFQYPENRFSSDTFAPHQRVKAYPQLGYSFKTRGLPQLTFFDAAYDVYAHDAKGAGTPAPCRYPQITTAMKAGVRKCLDPTALTAAELAEIAAEKKAIEAGFSASIAEQQAWGAAEKCAKHNTNYNGTKAYSITTADGGSDWYSCETQKKLGHTTQVVVKGLGADEGSVVIEAAVAKQKSSYRTTEYALAGLFLAGLYLVWKK